MLLSLLSFRQEATISLAFLACDAPNDIERLVLPLLFRVLKIGKKILDRSS